MNVNKTRSLPRVGMGSDHDHDIVIMTFNLRLKSPKKNKCVRNKFILEKLLPKNEKLFKLSITEKLME